MQATVEIFFYSPDLGIKTWLFFFKALPGKILAEWPNWTG